MKNAVKLSIKKPCSENFSNFSTTAKGGFCDSCQEEVIDFTLMAPEEIGNHFSSSLKKMCGRFTSSQLSTFAPTMRHTTTTNLVSRGIAIMSFSLVALCVSQVRAQETASVDHTTKTELLLGPHSTIMGSIALQSYTVKGTVLDEADLPLAGVNVVLKGSTEGVVTDFDGKFEFPNKLNEGDILIFSYIGFETKEYEVQPSEYEVIEISIQFDSTDIILMGDVAVEGLYKSKKNIFQQLIGLFK